MSVLIIRNNETMEITEIFSLLGNKVLDSIESVNEWKSASLKIKRLEKNVGFECYYIDTKGNNIDIDTSVNYQTAKAIQKLYEITQNQSLEHINWNRAIFTLYPDSKFDIKYIWDQELQDRVDQYNKD